MRRIHPGAWLALGLLIIFLAMLNDTMSGMTP